jgi:CheY-like chemotaxis protein
MVYLVDDDLDDLELVQEALKINSYKGPVNTLLNGAELLSKLNNPTTRPDVILLDLNMPLVNGFQALMEIKSNPRLRDIPVIVVTASSKKEDELRCFELGCNFFYTKPTAMDDYKPLAAMVKKLIISNDN